MIKFIITNRGELHINNMVIPITWLRENEKSNVYYQLFDFKDKNGMPVPMDWIIFNGTDYYQIYWMPENCIVQAESCTTGYIDEVSQEILNGFELIGPTSDNTQYLRCD